MMFPKKRRVVKPKILESEIQDQVENYLDANHIQYIRIPDPVYRFIFYSPVVPIWMKKLCSSYLKGVPDLNILIKDGEYNKCLCLELKRPGGVLRQGQGNWHKKANVKVAYSVQEAIDIIRKFEDSFG